MTYPVQFPASVPPFDWRGHDFLVVYLAALVVAAVWSYRRGSRLDARFNARSDAPDLHDPFEAAYLAGGPSRALQAAVISLLQRGLIGWKDSWTGGRLTAVPDAPSAPGMSSLERAILTAVFAAKKGVKLSEVGSHATSQLTSLEARLAAAGLRPTASERGRQGCVATLPLGGLLGIGVVKLFSGLSRDKPVAFLVISLVLTLITMAVVGALSGKRAGFLTPAGKTVLDRMRANPRRTGSGPTDVAMAVALFGPGAADLGAHLGLDDQIRKLHPASSSGGGGCGGISGCGGSSGCGSGCGGGGGCGGCGGGD